MALKVIRSGGDVVALLAGLVAAGCVILFFGVYLWGIVTGMATGDLARVERCVGGLAGTIVLIGIGLLLTGYS